jgi:hypothetical protein
MLLKGIFNPSPQYIPSGRREMGSRVTELEKKLDAGSDIGFILLVLIGMFIMSFLQLLTFDLRNISLIGWIAISTGFMVFLAGTISLLSSAYKIQADPQEFVDAYKWDYPQKKEIEILELAYKEAHRYQNEAFKDALSTWLSFGFYLTLLELGLFTGGLVIKNGSYFWAIFGITSIASFVSLILTIISYLRKRSIEKALFAIQLKKSDKAEISIKL